MQSDHWEWEREQRRQRALEQGVALPWQAYAHGSSRITPLTTARLKAFDFVRRLDNTVQGRSVPTVGASVRTAEPPLRHAKGGLLGDATCDARVQLVGRTRSGEGGTQSASAHLRGGRREGEGEGEGKGKGRARPQACACARGVARRHLD